MTHIEKRTLFTWLEKQGALKKYRVNRFKLTRPNDLPWRSYKCLSIEEAIIDAFNWGDTPERSGYWVSIHLHWLQYLKNHDT